MNISNVFIVRDSTISSGDNRKTGLAPAWIFLANLVPIVISSTTESGTTVTAMTASPHGLATGNSVMVSGVSPIGYNGTFTIVATGTNTFTYTAASGLTSPATTNGVARFAGVTQPTIYEIANGQYGFTFDAELSGESCGQIDCGSSLTNGSDRYVDIVLTRDSSRIQSAISSTGIVNSGISITVESNAIVQSP